MSDLPDQNNLSNLTAQATRLADAMEELNQASDEASSKAEKHAAAERGVEEICAKLNEVLPGLGSSLDLLTQGYRGGVEAAEAGAAANESFIASLGPIAVVLLGIQAAMQYWDMYKDKVKEAQEAQTEALEKMVDSLNKAREAQDRFFNAQHPKDDPIRNAENNFDRKTAVSRAEVEGRKKVLQTQENADMANAKSPEEREIIQRKYEGLNAQQDKVLETKTANAKQDEMGELNDAITKATAQGNDLPKRIVDANTAGDTETAKKLKEELDKVSDQLSQLNEKKGSLEADIEKDKEVSAVNDQTAAQTAVARVQGDDTVALAINAVAAGNRGPLTQAQKDAIAQLQQVYEAIGSNQQVMIAAMKHAADHQQSQSQEIQSIRQQLAALASQQRTG